MTATLAVQHGWQGAPAIGTHWGYFPNQGVPRQMAKLIVAQIVYQGAGWLAHLEASDDFLELTEPVDSAAWREMLSKGQLRPLAA